LRHNLQAFPQHQQPFLGPEQHARTQQPQSRAMER
jgi:hypothetical protein